MGWNAPVYKGERASDRDYYRFTRGKAKTTLDPKDSPARVQYRIFPRTMDAYTEIEAMKETTTVHLNDTERPKSSREKFLQAWNEKPEFQKCPIVSSQVPECQTATGIPIQTKEIQDEKHQSHLLTRNSLDASENAVYFLAMPASPHGQLDASSEATEPGSHQLPAAASCSPPEKSDKEEFLKICVSDLLLESPARKRPRLLPPNKKMHVEVQKKQDPHLPEESARSAAPLGNTMKMSPPANPPEEESVHHSPEPKQHSPSHPLAEGPSPSGDTEASTCPQPAEINQKQPQHLNQERSPPLPRPVIATQEYMGFPHISCLPPKKRYTKTWCL
uniref:Uncharacterized protein isoform X1 n=1 Tax=Pogona vitticeps TaxID=103695 RepID=A0A6J0URH7_9SAUR